MSAPIRTPIDMQEPPPHNIDVEQALLGALLTSNEVLQVVGNLTEEDFFDPLHQSIYRSIRALVAAGRRASAAVLATEYKTTKIVEGLNGAQYVARLLAEAVTLVDAPYYAQTIIDLATKRRLIAFAQKIDSAARLATVDKPASTLLDLAETELTNLRAGQVTSEVTSRSVSEIAKSLIESAEASAAGDIVQVPTTGLSDVDAAVGGGYPPSTLFVFAGATGSGKSQFAISSARKAARAGWGVIIFSLELEEKQVTARIIAAEMAHAAMTGQFSMAYSDAIKPRVDPQTLEQLRRGGERIEDLNIEIVDTPGLTAAQIAARTRLIQAQMAARGVRLAVVFVDYLGLVRPPNTGAKDRNKVNELGDIALDLREMAKRLKICVVALAQINRQAHSREDKRPLKSDLRASGEVEEHADVIGMFYRPAYYDRTDPKRDEPDRAAIIEARKFDLEINFDKNRLGPQQTITVHCNVATGLIENKRGW